VVQQLQDKDLAFLKQDLVPKDLNISMLPSLSLNQLITLKGKIINLQKPQKVHMGDCVLDKAEALLVDTSGSIQIVFWANDISHVKDNETYLFKNLRVKKNKFNGNTYVNPAKATSVITKCDPFEEALALP